MTHLIPNESVYSIIINNQGAGMMYRAGADYYFALPPVTQRAPLPGVVMKFNPVDAEQSWNQFLTYAREVWREGRSRFLTVQSTVYTNPNQMTPYLASRFFPNQAPEAEGVAHDDEVDVGTTGLMQVSEGVGLAQVGRIERDDSSDSYQEYWVLGQNYSAEVGFELEGVTGGLGSFEEGMTMLLFDGSEDGTLPEAS